jgi:alkylmercury lyase
MSHEPIDLEELSAAVSGRMPYLSDEEGAVALSLYRLLSEGSPVSVERLAEGAGRSQAEVMAVLGAWPGIFYEDEAIIGFWGLALDSTSHAFEVRSKRLSTWCAWDALFIPELIGQSALVSSRDPVTGEEISLTVGPGGIEEVSSPGVVVSFLDPSAIDFDDNVILNFCNYVHFFASVDSGTQWVAEHPGAFLLSLDEALYLGQRTNRSRYADGLAGAAEGAGDGRAQPRVVVQYFEGCAGWQTATDRLREALRRVGLGDHEIRFQNVETPEQAARLGFAGSPTILFNGVDLFADANPSAGYACRIYRTERGAEGAPSLSQLTLRLASASHDSCQPQR